MRFVLASHNQKKLRELGDILGALGIEVVPLPEGAARTRRKRTDL